MRGSTSKLVLLLQMYRRIKELRKSMLRRIVLMGIGFTMFSMTSLAQTPSAQTTTEKFGTLLYYIEQMYVDSVDSEELTEKAIRSMLEELDPHSSYISKEQVDDANAPLKGKFQGIGIQFNILKDTIMVVSPISGGPSDKLGIQAGDKIVEVNGENVAGVGITNGDVRDKLMGPKGTTVNVGIKRQGSKSTLEFPIVRDNIPIYSVDASYMLDEKTGYVKVNRFSSTTITELQQALVNMNDQGMQDLILDLQGNGGGYLQAAIQMADEFLSEQKLIVFTQGRAFPKDNFFAKHEGLFEKGRLIVLVDEGSASASEIVSGAIQDWDRGLIIGRRSFGKGLVQRPVPLPDGSEVRLTVQKYHTPSGRCIQKSYDNGVEAYRKEKYNRYDSGELYSMDGLEFPDSLKYETNIKKRTVYGGGGILPDLFVPLDTTMSSEYFSQLIRTGSFNQFVLSYANTNRESLMKLYPSSQDFLDAFEVSNAFRSDLIAYGENEGVEYNEEQMTISRKAVDIRLKALLGRNLFDSEVFYIVINDLNSALQAAKEAFNNGTFERANLAHKDF